MKKKNTNLLYINVRAYLDSKKELRVDFAYFDDYPKIVVDVTDKLIAADRADLEKLVFEDDPYIRAQIIMDIRDFVQIQEDIGLKMASELRRLNG